MPGIVQNRPDDTVITRQPRGNSVDELAAGGYERLIQLALGLTHSIFT